MATTRLRLLVGIGLLVLAVVVTVLVALPGGAAHPGAGPGAATGPGAAARRPATRAVTSSAHLRPSGEPVPASTAHPRGTPSSVAGSTVTAPPGWAVTVHHLASGGLDRLYLLARPDSTSPSAPTAGSLPVLIVLHGRMMAPAAMMAQSQFLDEVGPAIVVFPAGFDLSWNAGYCCGGAHAAGVDDVAFLQAVVAQVLAQQAGASPGHVYLAGFSNGGRMAYRVACDSPGLFAGVAAVEAVSVSACALTTPVPLLIVAQTGDPLLSVVPGEPPAHIEGHTETTVGAEVADWRGLDGCGPAAVTATFGDLSTQSWNQCHGEGRVEEAIYGGGAHTWFHGCQGTPSAQALVWSFFHEAAPTVSAAGPSCGGSRHARVA